MPFNFLNIALNIINKYSKITLKYLRTESPNQARVSNAFIFDYYMIANIQNMLGNNHVVFFFSYGSVNYYIYKSFKDALLQFVFTSKVSFYVLRKIKRLLSYNYETNQ